MFSDATEEWGCQLTGTEYLWGDLLETKMLLSSSVSLSSVPSPWLAASFLEALKAIVRYLLVKFMKPDREISKHW